MLLTALLTVTAIGLAYLILERARLDRHRKAIPLLIGVSGTRGKSSVTRMLASVLRGSGRRVLAKTTGSEATIILPDGSEREIRRRGRPSIIEQKHLVRLGADLDVDAAVVEFMSIRPEYHQVEAHRILRPDIVLVTNFRVDHTAATGYTRQAVASALALDVPPGARAFVPQQECVPEFREAVEDAGGELIELPAGVGSALLGEHTEWKPDQFGENLDLICGAARALGVDDATLIEGVRRARGDLGALRIWRYRPADFEAHCLLVNAFAANDPESTGLVFERLTGAVDANPKRCVGLLNLRPDRGDRTLQWLEALRGGFLKRFSQLFVLGLHARALERRLRRCDAGTPIAVLCQKEPVDITRTVLSGLREAGGVVFGFGNIGGAGEALVKYWSELGESWEIAS
jgi:poly-gamma-glutamate synthase PgsB/CapB